MTRPRDQSGKLLIFLLLAVIVAALRPWRFFAPTPDDRALQAREIATRGLASHLDARFRGKKMVVLANPYAARPDTDPEIKAAEESGIAGLKAAFAGPIVVESPPLKPGALENPRAFAIPDTSTPLVFLLEARAFDQVLKKQAGTAVAVSLIGAPLDLEQHESWRSGEAPLFAFLFPDVRLMGGPEGLKRLLQSVKLEAVVLRKPNGLPDSSPAKRDWTSEFTERFILVTRESFENQVKQFPAAFR